MIASTATSAYHLQPQRRESTSSLASFLRGGGKRRKSSSGSGSTVRVGANVIAGPGPTQIGSKFEHTSGTTKTAASPTATSSASLPRHFDTLHSDSRRASSAGQQGRAQPAQTRRASSALPPVGPGICSSTPTKERAEILSSLESTVRYQHNNTTLYAVQAASHPSPTGSPRSIFSSASGCSCESDSDSGSETELPNPLSQSFFTETDQSDLYASLDYYDVAPKFVSAVNKRTSEVPRGQTGTGAARIPRSNTISEFGVRIPPVDTSRGPPVQQYHSAPIPRTASFPSAPSTSPSKVQGLGIGITPSGARKFPSRESRGRSDQVKRDVEVGRSREVVISLNTPLEEDSAPRSLINPSEEVRPARPLPQIPTTSFPQRVTHQAPLNAYPFPPQEAIIASPPPSIPTRPQPLPFLRRRTDETHGSDYSLSATDNESETETETLPPSLPVSPFEPPIFPLPPAATLEASAAVLYADKGGKTPFGLLPEERGIPSFTLSPVAEEYSSIVASPEIAVYFDGPGHRKVEGYHPSPLVGYKSEAGSLHSQNENEEEGDVQGEIEEEEEYNYPITFTPYVANSSTFGPDLKADEEQPERDVVVQIVPLDSGSTFSSEESHPSLAPIEVVGPNPSPLIPTSSALQHVSNYSSETPPLSSSSATLASPPLFASRRTFGENEALPWGVIRKLSGDSVISGLSLRSVEEQAVIVNIGTNPAVWERAKTNVIPQIVDQRGYSSSDFAPISREYCPLQITPLVTIVPGVKQAERAVSDFVVFPSKLNFTTHERAGRGQVWQAYEYKHRPSSEGLFPKLTRRLSKW